MNSPSTPPAPREGRPIPYEPRVPSDTMPPGRAAISVSWAALPFLTLGWATPFTFAAAALWRRTPHVVVAALVYAGVFALQIVVLPDIDHDPRSRNVFGACVLVQALVACAHAFIIRRRVFDLSGSEGLGGNEAAIEWVRRQRLLRQKARDLAQRDPGLARELRIGRPDLHRRYDDGGLVDVNHAPASSLETLPGITRELADRIERIRSEAGGFSSAEELSAVAALPPALTPDLAEFGLFLP
jgi:hypothetical protein